MSDYPEGAQLEDLIKMNRLLVDCGANITEINTVRKHLSKVKGGQLAREAQPACLVTLILSDVPGDALDIIASGPTVPDTSNFLDAMNIVKKFGLEPEMPPALLKYLKDGAEGRIPETPKRGDPVFKNTHNIIIGNNEMALQASLQKAVELGFETKIPGMRLEGDATLMARSIVDYAVKMQSGLAIKNKFCLLFGGETTIKVAGAGLGGRNQHLALAAAIELADKPGITLLSAGTDGTDGPTDATGAVVDFQTTARARAKGIDPRLYLQEFDTYHFFQKAGGHVITGPTMTNVMDMVVVLIEKS
jgi:glycerate 2-kinase